MGAGESMRIARRQADGTIEVDGKPVGVPGDDGVVTLTIIPTATTIGATEFIVTDTGDWLATVASTKYAVHLGVIEDAGELILLGLRSEYDVTYVDLIHPDGLMGKLRPPARKTASVDGKLLRSYMGDRTSLTVTRAQARELYAALTTVLAEFNAEEDFDHDNAVTNEEEEHGNEEG